MFFSKEKSVLLTGKTVAFGMNEAAGLHPSSFLKKTMPEEAENAEDAAALVSALDELYKKNTAVAMDCDYTSVRILQIYGETGFDFSVNYLLALHTRLFSDFRPAAGSFRKDKAEKHAPGKFDNHDWLTAPEEIPAALVRLFAAKHTAFAPAILGGSAVSAPAVLSGSTTLAPSAPSRSMVSAGSTVSAGGSAVSAPSAPGSATARAASGKGAASPQALAAFSAGLWQIHPFAFGNTRTLVLFLIKYLQSAASGANISPLWEHAVSFREALIMANPEARAYGTAVITRPLESLFEIIL